MGLAVHQLRQTRIGQDGKEPRPVFRQPLHMFGHLLGAGGAVQAHNRNVQGVYHRGCGGDVGPHQHGARGLHRDLNDDGDVGLDLRAGAFGTVDRCFDLKRVLAGFDKEGVNAARRQPVA